MTGAASGQVSWPFKDEVKTDAVAYWVEMRQGLSEPYVGFVARGEDEAATSGEAKANRFSLVLSDQLKKAINVSPYTSLANLNLTDELYRTSLPACASCNSLSRRAPHLLSLRRTTLLSAACRSCILSGLRLQSAILNRLLTIRQ